MHIEDDFGINDKVKFYLSTIQEIKEKGKKIKYISDAYSQFLKSKVVDLHKIYDSRDENKELKTLIIDQKGKLISSLALFEKEMDMYFASGSSSSNLISKFIEMYHYCIKKGYLDVAEYYLYFLFEKGFINDDFFIAGLSDIVEGYAKISVLSNLDKRSNVVNLYNKLKNMKYKKIIKSLKAEDLSYIYNTTGRTIDWEGIIVTIHPDPVLLKSDFLGKKFTRKN